MQGAPPATKQRITDFFDRPRTPSALVVRAIIIALILFSTGAMLVELLSPNSAVQYRALFSVMEVVVGGVFALEYLLRLWASDSPRRFIFNFYNIIDLCAILPLFITGTNISALRVVRLARFLRGARLLSIGKLFRYFWRANVLSTTHVVQENVIKNIVLIIILFGSAHSLKAYLASVDVEVLGDVLFASSIVAVGAMFGFFGLSYQKMNPASMAQRFFMHLTTGLLLLPIGITFLIVQSILEIKMGSSPFLIVSVVWLVYTAIVLWDMWNALSMQEVIPVVSRHAPLHDSGSSVAAPPENPQV